MSPFSAAGSDDSSRIESPARLLDELDDAWGRVGRVPKPAATTPSSWRGPLVLLEVLHRKLFSGFLAFRMSQRATKLLCVQQKKKAGFGVCGALLWTAVPYVQQTI